MGGLHLDECCLDLGNSLRPGRAGADRRRLAFERPADLQGFKQVPDLCRLRQNEGNMDEIGADGSAKIGAASFPQLDDAQSLPALEGFADGRATYCEAL